MRDWILLPVCYAVYIGCMYREDSISWKMERIYIIEDDENIHESVENCPGGLWICWQEGFESLRMEEATARDEGGKAGPGNLDWMLPGMDGTRGHQRR